ncbi:MAG: hydroxyquinol 1,2-dioxygenase [Pseudomonadota bacterium]
MTTYETVFGSIDNYVKGGVEVIDDDPRNYVFSNMFEVAAKSAPYERVAVAKNFEYVIEAARAEGTSPWYTCAHDEFAVSLDGKVEVHLVKLNDPDGIVDPESEGAHRLDDLPDGTKMGRIVLGKGHMAMLPQGSAYRFHADSPATLMIQTIDGPVTVHKWAEICQTAA